MRLILLIGLSACAFMGKADLDTNTANNDDGSDTSDSEPTDTEDTGDTTDSSDTADTSDTDTNDSGVIDTASPPPVCMVPNASVTSAGNLIQMNGVQGGDLFGWEVLACDVNNDGYDDVIASAPYSNALLGKVAVFYGPGNLWGGNMNISSADTSIAETNSSSSGLFGARLGCGDIDGDGDDDLLVGRGEGRNGFSGSSDVGLFVYKNTGQNWGAQMNASNADLQISFDSGVSDSASTPHFPLFWVEDVDGDSIDEVLLFMNSNSYYTPYAPNADNTVWKLDLELVFGAANMDTLAVNRLTPSGIDSVTQILPIGDLNNDGQVDFFFGEGFHHAGNAIPGNAVFSFGYPSSSANLSTIGYAQFSGVGSDRFGQAAAFGDFKGDGTTSFAIGAPGGSNGLGYLHFYSVSPDTLSGTTSGTGAASGVFNGPETGGSLGFGWKVKNVGDFDGDGADDVMATSVGEAGQSGYAYILSGPCLGGFYLLDESALLRIEGLGTESYFGYSADAGDINGDGVSDLIIGAYNTFLSSSTYPEGRIFVYLSGN